MGAIAQLIASQQITAAGATHPLAIAYIATTGRNNPTFVSALDVLVNGLDTDGILGDYDQLAILAGPGATSGTAYVNLITPGTLNLTPDATNPPTVSTNGVQGNGTNQFVDTNYNPNTHFTLTSGFISFYCRNNTDSGYDCGANDGGGPGFPHETGLIARNGNLAYSMMGTNGYAHTQATTDSRGLWCAFIDATFGQSHLTLRGVESTAALSDVVQHPAFNMYLCANNSGGTAHGFTDHLYGYYGTGQNRTVAKALLEYNRFQTFFTALGLQV